MDLYDCEETDSSDKRSRVKWFSKGVAFQQLENYCPFLIVYTKHQIT